MALCILAAGFEQILTRLPSNNVGQFRDDWFPIGPGPWAGRQLALPDDFEFRFAIELGDVARRREPIRLPGNAAEAKRGFNRHGQRLAVEPHRDKVDRQWSALLEDCVETAKTEIKIRTLLHESAGFGDGLLTEVGNFTKQLGRPRLRCLWIYR